MRNNSSAYIFTKPNCTLIAWYLRHCFEYITVFYITNTFKRAHLLSTHYTCTFTVNTLYLFIYCKRTILAHLL